METKTIFTKQDVFKNTDEDGRLLTYQVIDYNGSSLRKDFGKRIAEFNTLKELNKFLKKQ